MRADALPNQHDQHNQQAESSQWMQRRMQRRMQRMSEPQPDDQPANPTSATAPLMAESRSLKALLDLCARYMSDDDLALIREAYQVAAAAHAGVARRSGEPFVEHTIAVAGILAELAMDAQGIAAALLHDTVEECRARPHCR